MHSKLGLQLHAATPADTKTLGEFYTSIATLGTIDVKIQRRPDYFSFYQKLGLTHKTYLIKDGNEVVGSATFLFKYLKFQNRNLKLAHACDLRISSNRKVVRSWSSFFQPILEELRKNENCDGFMTSINQTETQSMNAFIRPKLKRSTQPHYALSKTFNLVSVHGFFPLFYSVNKNIKVRPFLSSDKDSLKNYIKKNLNKYDYLPVSLSEDIDQYINDSLIYSWNQFYIALDHQENIVGCVHPVSSSLLQDYLPQDYSSQAHNLRQFLKAAQLFKFGRRLTRPYSRSQKQEALSFRLLHFLITDHPEVLNALIKTSYDTSVQNEFIIYAYETTEFQKRPPKFCIYSEIPYGLYSIESINREAPRELSLLNSNKFWLDFIWF